MSMSFKASPDGTYGEILVNGQVVAKLPVSGNAVIPNLVGTVSQSGGVPTGAVVERGSNANGEYVRFADGTQICATPVIVGGATWTYPAVFTSVDAITATCNSSTPRMASTSGVNTTTAVIHAFTDAGVASSVGVMCICIGRWF